jgi:hypothetical protein
MSQDDLVRNLLHGARRAGHLVDELMDRPPSALLPGGGVLDRSTLRSRSFWTGAALGAATVLTLAAVLGKRGEPARSPTGRTRIEGGS